MDAYTVIILLILMLIIRKYVLRKFTNQRKFPPGPLQVPVLGSIPSIIFSNGNSPHDVMWNISKKYGNIVGLNFASQPAVLITGYEMVKHVLSKDEFSNRPNLVPVTTQYFGKRLGVFFTYGDEWREQRRFTLRHLRDFGFGKRTMESVIHDEANSLINFLDKLSDNSKKQGVNLSAVFPVLAINVLWTIMAGIRHELDDSEFIKLTNVVMSFFRSGSPFDPVLLSPTLQKIPIINSGYKKMKLIIQDIREFVEHSIEEHVKTYDENALRDFIDVYIKEINNNPNSTFTRDQLCCICMDLFNAGTETTASTVAYALRYLVQYPNIQEKLRAEILNVIGTGRLPSMEDMNNLPYTQAVITETIRHSGLVPFTPPHAASHNVQLNGYEIPKDCLVLILLWSVHMDPNIWGDPENFRPERFIQFDGSFKKDDHYLGFSAGPRVCLGEPLAKFTTLILIATMVQNFKFEPFGRVPSNEQLSGFTTSPAPYKVTFQRI